MKLVSSCLFQGVFVFVFSFVGFSYWLESIARPKRVLANYNQISEWWSIANITLRGTTSFWLLVISPSSQYFGFLVIVGNISLKTGACISNSGAHLWERHPLRNGPIMILAWCSPAFGRRNVNLQPAKHVFWGWASWGSFRLQLFHFKLLGSCLGRYLVHPCASYSWNQCPEPSTISKVSLLGIEIWAWYPVAMYLNMHIHLYIYIFTYLYL